MLQVRPHTMQQLQVAVRRQGGQEQQELFEAPVPSSYVEHKLEQKYGPGALCLEGSNVMLAPALTLQPSQRCVYDVFGGVCGRRWLGRCVRHALAIFRCLLPGAASETFVHACCSPCVLAVPLLPCKFS